MPEAHPRGAPGDTHTYDGTLPDLIQAECSRAYAAARRLSPLERGSITAWLHAALRAVDAYDPVAQYWFGVCVGGEDPQNYDPVNRVHTQDLLMMCWALHEAHPSTEFLSTLARQLSEIQGGACPQGRTTRIFQAYMAHKRSLESPVNEGGSPVSSATPVEK